MKKFLLLLCCIFHHAIYAQTLYAVRDTVNQYEIGVPEGWMYKLMSDVEQGVRFFAYRPKTGNDVPSENYNVNIVKTTETDFQKTYHDYKKSVTHPSSKIIKEGEITLYGRKYKWLIESHNNLFDETRKMMDYSFFTNNNGTVVIITMVTLYERFDQYKPLFDQVIHSFKY